MRTRSMIEAWSVGALRASWPANSPAALPQQGIRLRNASRQRPEVSGGELFLLPRGFFALLAQGLTNLMASLPRLLLVSSLSPFWVSKQAGSLNVYWWRNPVSLHLVEYKKL